MRRVGSFLTVIIALAIISSACSATAARSTKELTLPSSEASPSMASPPQAATSTQEPSATPPETPTNIPVTPTATPTPAMPSGTLILKNQFGYGTGFPFSPYGIQLSSDGKRLIAVTSAGIIVFRADDLTRLFFIPESSEFLSNLAEDNIGISRDGNLAVVLSRSLDDFSLVYRLWDLISGVTLGEFEVKGMDTLEGFWTSGLQITPDNKKAIVLQDNGTIWALNLASGEVESLNEDYVNNTQNPLWLEIDPEGNYVYYVFRDIGYGVQSAKLNSVSLMESSLATSKRDYFPWTRGAFSPILSASGYQFGYFTDAGSRTVAAMDYSTLNQRFKIKRTDPVSAITFSPDGSMVLMAGTGPTQLELWKVDTLEAPEESIPVASRLWTAALSSAGEYLYGITDEGILGMWQRGNPEPLRMVEGFLPVAYRLEYLEDGSSLRLYSRYDETVHEVDPATGHLNGVYPNPYYLDEMGDRLLYKWAVSPDKGMMAATYVSSYDKDIRLFDVPSGKFLRKIHSNIPLDFIEFTPDGKSLIVYGFNEKPIIRILDLETGKILKTVPVNEGHGDYSIELKLSGDKSTLAVLGQLGVMDIYRTDTFDVVQSLVAANYDEYVGAFAISNDGSRLALVNTDLQVWDRSNNAIVPAFQQGNEDHDVIVNSLVFSPDDHQLAVATYDGGIFLYDIAP